jgi:hypothetical protein
MFIFVNSINDEYDAPINKLFVDKSRFLMGSATERRKMNNPNLIANGQAFPQ